MTAKLTCNSCGADVDRRDGNNPRREFENVGITAYVESVSRDECDLHLCVPCIVKVLSNGKRPEHEPSERDF